ncbi:sulfatase [Planctomicrobium sp. SH668]|uniref:sulfatase n=1 Tax=Planctomicrobium sp. SH668 TaxID=3448126 RepID=UPI003F5C6BA0
MRWLIAAVLVSLFLAPVYAADTKQKMNVLLIISDDLTATALGCYGNTLCSTPNIDQLAARGMRFERAYCNATYCGPSRASLLSGYYPHATQLFEYGPVRPTIGDRATLPQHFINNGYYSARVSKIFHMGIPGDIVKGGNSSDDERSWTERFNSQGPEWQAPGDGETLESNPDETKPVMGGNTFVVVEADGDDLVHSDGKTASKAVELIEQHAAEPFFLAVGFVRPHVPFVAPSAYFKDYLPYDSIPLPEKVVGDWDDIPAAGINYKTSINMQMDERKQRKAIGGYYAAVSYLDAQVGKVLDALDQSGQADNTVIVFTSDHGFHLGEHDFWAKVSLMEESTRVPLIISVPGREPGVSHSLVELIDLYPTLSSLAGLPQQNRLQGKDISTLLVDPSLEVRNSILCTSPARNGLLVRTKDWSYIQYGTDGEEGAELYDLTNDPHQYQNLATVPEKSEIVASMKQNLLQRLAEARKSDLTDE